VSMISHPNPNLPADGDDPLRALAAVQVALDRRDNGGDAEATRDQEAARAAGTGRMAGTALRFAAGGGFGRRN
jgi:hypothetical protein